jgi:hypothetical protein
MCLTIGMWTAGSDRICERCLGSANDKVVVSQPRLETAADINSICHPRDSSNHLDNVSKEGTTSWHHRSPFGYVLGARDGGERTGP